MKFTSHSLEETKRVARNFVAGLLKMKHSGATVVGLHGNLGSGKTTFAQCVAEVFGVQERLTSPTFVIMRSYTLPPSTVNHKPYTLLVHIDAYRLKSGEELAKLGFKELLIKPGNLILIEWPENVQNILPPDTKKLSFQFVDETTREIEL